MAASREAHSKGMQMLARVMVMSTPALSILIFFSLICIVLFGSLMYFAEGASYSVADDFVKAPKTAANPHGALRAREAHQVALPAAAS